MGESPTIQEFEADLRASPPLTTFINRIVANTDTYEEHGLRDVTDVLGDRAFTSLLELLGEHEADAEQRVILASAIMSAVPVLWPRDMLLTAVGMKLPDHIIDQNLCPYDVMWWRLALAPKEFEAMLILNVAEAQEVMAVVFKVGENRVDITGRVPIKYGARWPEDFPDELHRGCAEIVLSMMAFMNSRFIDAGEELLPRAERRRLERAGVFEDCDRTHVIRLRAEEPSQSQAGSDSMPGTWSHRWIVRGHYRAQWYPSKQAHEVKWIAPHMKGPADKPVKLPAVVVRQ